MDLSTQRLMQAAAGAGGDKVYVEDVFSTYLYDGNGSTQSINNGIDESGEGALTWIKMRSHSGDYHHLYDTERGAGKTIFSNSNVLEQASDTDRLSAFNSNGFSLGSNYRVNGSGRTFVSWTFRKSPGFFDCMLYDGNSESAFNLSHNLGVIPALIMIKPRSGPFSNGRWYVWMKGMSTNNQIRLDSDAEQTSDSNYRIGQNATASHIQIPVGSDINSSSSGKFVAYVFADGDQSDAQIFGKTGDQQLTKSGTYTGNGSSNGTEVNLGFEPQWLLVKEINGTGNWQIVDSMRGIVTNGNDTQLRPNTTSGDDTRSLLDLTPTGFKLTSTNSYWNENGKTYCYFAIRRPDGYVGKPPSAGTDVFAMDVGNSSSTIPSFDTTFNVDFALARYFGSTDNWFAVSRLMQGHPLLANSTGTEDTQSWAVFDANNGWGTGFGSSRQSWMWKRHAGFDVVCYTGVNPSSDAQSVSHGLGKVPEMMWLKKRSGMGGWNVYHKGLNGGTNPEQYSIQLNTDAAEGQYATDFNNTAPTSTHFTVGPGNSTNQNGATFIAMLFASVSGISKVGYYDGSESEQTITTGFQPRFVIIKRVNNTQNWYVLDTTRGWASGVDQFLQLNQSAAQDNSYDLGAPTSTGFTLTGNNLRTNNGGDKYIYYCHA